MTDPYSGCMTLLSAKCAGSTQRAPALPYLRDLPPGLHYDAISYWGGLATDPFEWFDTRIEAEAFVGDAEMVLHLLRPHRPVQHAVFMVGQPILEDLVAADL